MDGGGCLHGHQMLKDAGRPRLKLCRYKIEGSELNRHSQTVAIFQKGTSMTNIESKKINKKEAVPGPRHKANHEGMVA